MRCLCVQHRERFQASRIDVDLLLSICLNEVRIADKLKDCLQKKLICKVLDRLYHKFAQRNECNFNRTINCQYILIVKTGWVNLLLW